MYIFSFKRYIVVLAFVIVTLLISMPSSKEASTYNVDRISGENRYKTAVEVSKQGWSNGADTIIITGGNQFPDALTGTPLAFSLNAPILLTNRNYLPSETKNEITRLKPKKVIILGGDHAVSSNVANELLSMGLELERIYGGDRYETAAKIAERIPNKGTAVVVYGKNFPDSLSVAAHAAKNGYPILLTDTNTLPSKTKESLSNYRRTIVVGGEAVVSKQVYGQLPAPARYSGADRYQTLSNVVKGLNVKFNQKVYIATGENFADALTGSVLAAKENTSLVLVGKDQVPGPIQNILKSLSTSNATIIGGANAVSSAVESHLKFGEPVIDGQVFDVNSIISTARQYMGVPYLWGGITPSGFDCSGYLGYVFNKHGISLPRTVAEMWEKGTSVSQPEVGDIVFFTTYKAGPSHAGIYIGNNEFIHASSTSGVTIHSMSNSYFYPRYLGAKRLH
ncbi:cell wall-binding repeat-containing protein [Sutcliffiella deserti]|uniref:cell wall-binding repeat-containing protein n=1 Tax=Sutcliffiella deserti TaxID=2875501 RepID=UPI00295B9E83|nr:cell wall-binding repeat-containing protein [Sutcliffiella deserti]